MLNCTMIHAGSCLHVDQCLWSNVGKNFSGYKVMAVWPFGAVSNEVLDDHFSQLFRPVGSKRLNEPNALTDTQLQALRSCVKMVIVQPGDVFVFSGACAHMAM